MDKAAILEDMNAEYQKCSNDPAYFISNYVKVIHPIRGLVTFKLYPFQEHIVHELENHRFNILKKFRQAGCTTTCVGYALHQSIFREHQSIVFLSMGDTESTEILDRIKIAYDSLPVWIRPKIKEDNKHTFKLENGSVIKSRPSGKQSGRSLAGTMLIIDEAAFIENIGTIWAAVYPIISTGGKAFILSTVNGVGNWYHDLWLNSEAGANSFNSIDIKWQDHPEYRKQDGFDELYEELEDCGINVDLWEETTKSNIPYKQWLQEYEAEFLGTGETFLEGRLLKTMLDSIDTEFDIKYNNRMRVWAEPDPNHTYILGADTALGRDRDYSAFQIIDAYNGQQVAEFYSNRTPIDNFAEVINREGLYYNNALVVIERNTIGENVIDHLYNRLQYENLWMDNKYKIGFQVTTKTRENLLAKLEEYIRNNIIKVNSKRTVDELLTFIITENGRIEADAGKNDDLIIGLALAIQGLITLLDSGQLAISEIPFKEVQPLTPLRSLLKTGFGEQVEEDLKWMIR